MDKIRLFLPLHLLLIVQAAAQTEQAPTRRKCQADADEWGIPKASPLAQNDYQFRNLTRDVARDATISAKKLDARIDELSMCIRADSAQTFRYDQAIRAYNIAMWFRMADIVSRHNLPNQFYQPTFPF
jgi:hypothetical protein